VNKTQFQILWTIVWVTPWVVLITWTYVFKRLKAFEKTQGEAPKRTDPRPSRADEPPRAKSVKRDERNGYRLEGIPQSDPQKPEAREH